MHSSDVEAAERKFVSYDIKELQKLYFNQHVNVTKHLTNKCEKK